jgi:hypothetical protein
LTRQLNAYLADADRTVPARVGRGFELKAFPASVGVDVLESLAALGVTDAIVMPWLYFQGDPMDLQFRVESVQRFATEIMPKFRN